MTLSSQNSALTFQDLHRRPRLSSQQNCNNWKYSKHLSQGLLIDHNLSNGIWSLRHCPFLSPSLLSDDASLSSFTICTWQCRVVQVLTRPTWDYAVRHEECPFRVCGQSLSEAQTLVSPIRPIRTPVWHPINLSRYPFTTGWYKAYCITRSPFLRQVDRAKSDRPQILCNTTIWRSQRRFLLLAYERVCYEWLILYLLR